MNVILEPEQGYIILKGRRVKEVSEKFVSVFKGIKSNNGWLVRHNGRLYHEKTKVAGVERGRLLKGGSLYQLNKGNAEMRCFEKIGTFKEVSDDEAIQVFLGDILVTKNIEYISKSDPNNPDDFAGLVTLMWRKFVTATKPTDAEYEKFFFGVVEGVDWADASKTQIKTAIKTMNSFLPATTPKVMKKVKVLIKENGGEIYKSTKKAMKKDFSLDIKTSLNLADKKAIEAISTFGEKYIPKSFKKQSAHLTGVVVKNVEYGLTKGFSSGEIASNIYKELGEKIPIRRNTWIKLAAHAAVARSRSRSQIRSYVEAEIEETKVDAVMDEATTETCAFLDGKTISVSVVDKQWTALEEGDGDFEDVFPWLTQSKKGDNITISVNGKAIASGISGAVTFNKGFNMGKIQALGVGMPPYHGKCRSTTYIE